jgi:N-glycosidase YbiA
MTWTIDRFRGEYAFLSNFYTCKVDFEDDEYRSAEHAYQAAKTLDPTERAAIRSAAAPGLAKVLGRKLILRSGWDDMRISVMRTILLSKFSDPELRNKLQATGNATLVECNHWDDTFWGVCRGKGQNYLGWLLMEVRNGNFWAIEESRV